MIRRCPVIDCDNTEDQTPGHRFPQSKEQAQYWKDSLKLKEFPIELLQTKFFVCKNHFSSSDYDNDGHLLTTAIPNLTRRDETETLVDLMDGMLLQVGTVNSTGSAYATDSESIEVVAPPIERIAFVQRLALPRNCESTCTATEDSAYSNEICILEAHDSHYGMEPCKESIQSCAYIQLVDAPDFTVLNADGECKYSMIQRHHTCTLCKNSSTIVLAQQQSKQPNNATSGTDSDVEILMSEEIIYSDWSAENNEDLLTLSTSGSGDGRENAKPDLAPAAIIPECSDQDITEENFSLESIDAFELMTHSQLKHIIKSQAAKIRAMEATLKRYRDAQTSLFLHVDALRVEFDNDDLINGLSGGGKAAPYPETIRKKCNDSCTK